MGHGLLFFAAITEPLDDGLSQAETNLLPLKNGVKSRRYVRHKRVSPMGQHLLAVGLRGTPRIQPADIASHLLSAFGRCAGKTGPPDLVGQDGPP
jgi:hypothetical protein